MIKFAIKTAIVGSAIYVLREEGVWKESTESLKAYDKLNTSLQPCINELRKQFPVQLPQVPDSARASETAKIYWNKGVTSTFQFLSELPGKVSTWTSDGVNAILTNPEVKKLWEGEGEGKREETPAEAKTK